MCVCARTHTHTGARAIVLAACAHCTVFMLWKTYGDTIQRKLIYCNRSCHPHSLCYNLKRQTSSLAHLEWRINVQRKAIKETPLSALRLKLAETQFKCTLSKWGSIFKSPFVSVYAETGNKEKWELGGLQKLEAAVCSSFGSQHNERALSDMNTCTSLHGKLKVASLPSSYETALSQIVRPLCASRSFPFSNKTNFTILKLRYTFQLLFGALQTSDYFPRI
jgi:hypothetical protein